MASLIDGHDWAATSLGPIDSWPVTLRSTVATMLASRFPIYIAWGPERISLYNDAFLPIVAGKHPGSLGMPLRELWSEIHDDLKTFIDQAYRDESSYFEDMPVQIIREGRLEDTFFTFSYSGIRGDMGEVEGLYCVCIETTEAVVARQQKVSDSDRLRAMFQQAPGFIAVLRGPDHVFEITNAAYVQLVGERPLVGLPVRQALPELEGQGFYELLDEVYRTGKPFSASEIEATLTPDPTRQPVTVLLDFIYQPILDDSGNVTGIFCEGTDATERANSRSALVRSEERLRDGLTAAKMVLWDWNLESNAVEFSDNAPAIIGGGWTSIAEVWKAIHPDDLLRLASARDAAVASRGSYEQVVRYIRPDNAGLSWLRIHGRVVCDADGKPTTVRGVSVDVSALKNAEESIREEDRLKTEFLAMLAHELRNPLAPVVNGLSIMKLKHDDAEAVATTRDMIERQVSSMVHLVNDLLDVARVAGGKVELRREPITIAEIVNTAIETSRPLIDAGAHQLQVHLGAGSSMVNVDRVRLVQVISNLLNNAAKYTRPNGTIVISTVRHRQSTTISVTDNGIGIAPSELPVIFQMFSQVGRGLERAQGGLGVGLALVRRLVEMHGGNVTARSPGIDGGSTFEVTLPLAEIAEESPKRSPSARLLQPATPLRVLVVDDNVDGAESLAALLLLQGHPASVAHSGRQAVERACGGKFDVMFLDIGMPGMNGYEALGELKKLDGGKQCYFVALTGWGTSEDRERALVAGFNSHLTKPVDLASVCEVLERAGQKR